MEQEVLSAPSREYPMNTASDPVPGCRGTRRARAASVIIDASRDLTPAADVFRRSTATSCPSADTRSGERDRRDHRCGAFPEHADAVARNPARSAGRTMQTPSQLGRRPIDGSLNFVHGFPYYAVSIALAKNDEITHAVVLDPLHDELFTRGQGQAAQRNGAQIHVSACTRLVRRARGHRASRRDDSPKLPRLPAGVQRARSRSARASRRAGRARARPGASRVAGRTRRLLGDEPQGVGRRRGRLLVTRGGRPRRRFRRRRRVPAHQRGDRVRAPGLFNPLREAIAVARPASTT